MWKRAWAYGALMAVGAAALQGLTYQRLARPWALDGLVFVVAAAFLVLGVWVGVQLWHRSPPGRKPPDRPAPGDAVPLPGHEASTAAQAAPSAQTAQTLAAAAEAEPQPSPALADPAAPLLSARELTVLHQLAAGLSNKEIAQRLHLSPHTVKTHVAHVFEKLGARRRTEAIHKARERGIVR